jgi:uncharacterized membrane protein
MNKARLETFSDGVIAILITIMVLELRTPESADLHGLHAILPSILTYLLSFLYLGIYWNNHHHTFVLVEKVSGGVLWANLHLLFWLSLIPFGTVWLGENHSAAVPAAAYGVILLMSAVAYTILLRVIIATQGAHSKLAAAIGDDRKGMISLALYVLAIPLAFVASWMSDLLYMTVALIWFIPDRRIERKLAG